VLRELDLERLESAFWYMSDGMQNAGMPVFSSLGEGVACFLQGSELESLLGTVYLFDGTHNFGTVDLLRGLMDPTVTLPILKWGRWMVLVSRAL
jgi:hypothetical protein